MYTSAYGNPMFSQIDAVERTLIHSIQRTLHCFTSPHITMIELGIPPLILQQVLQLVALHFRYTVLHTNTIAAKLYNLRCQFRCSNSHLKHTIENRIAKAHSTLMISSTYPGPPSMSRSVTLAKLPTTPLPPLSRGHESGGIPTCTSTPYWQCLFKTTCPFPPPPSVPP